ncbi:MAG: dienelactone hydrolase family protein [Planctomycetes bacterium]|nr:dienelactone hydrolase family protein [Planctomycetota bacterium]
MKFPTTSTRREFLIASAAACGAAAIVRAADGKRGREVAWLKEVQQGPAKPPAGVPKLAPLLVDAKGRAITTIGAWRARREALRRWWIDFLGVLPRAKMPPKYKVLKEDRDAGALRQLIRYEVEPGVPVEAYLLMPLKIAGRVPGVVVLHSTVDHTIRQPAGVQGKPQKAFGLKLARRGMVAICPRNFLWDGKTDNKYTEHVRRFHRRHPKSKGMARMLHDAQVATDILAALPQVDPQRLGSVGHSLGAKEVLYLAAFDERIKATVSSEGGLATTYSNWDAPWYLGETIRDKRAFTHEHHELLALCAPRAMLILGGDSADGDRSWPLVAAALKVYDLHQGPSRLGLFNHKKGHAVPKEATQRIDEWLGTYLYSGRLHRS